MKKAAEMQTAAERMGERQREWEGRGEEDTELGSAARTRVAARLAGYNPAREIGRVEGRRGRGKKRLAATHRATGLGPYAGARCGSCAPRHVRSPHERPQRTPRPHAHSASRSARHPKLS